jgi:hypothetical protein
MESGLTNVRAAVIGCLHAEYTVANARFCYTPSSVTVWIETEDSTHERGSRDGGYRQGGQESKGRRETHCRVVLGWTGGERAKGRATGGIDWC